MTQDEVLNLAREAGLIHILDEHAHEYGSGTFENTPYPELEAFANLVAAKAEAKEREACAKVCDEFCYGSTKVLVERAIRARGEQA